MFLNQTTSGEVIRHHRCLTALPSNHVYVPSPLCLFILKKMIYLTSSPLYRSFLKAAPKSLDFDGRSKEPRLVKSGSFIS